jgi:serine/threonine-protein kinase HipA
MDLTLEKHLNGEWQTAARLTIATPALGIRSPSVLEYDPHFALHHLDERGEAAVSVNHPVDFAHARLSHWPAFLLDILPSGFGRDLLVRHEAWRLPDGPHNDVAVLAHGASNPAGNLRVKEAWEWLSQQIPPADEGWTLEDMRRHDADFIEYARLHGTLVAGTSTQGQAAKLWITRHQNGLYHADILVSDDEADAFYLLKLPRNPNDALLLEHEFKWLQLAKVAGLDVHGEPFVSGELLFIPRFDRRKSARGVERRAMESAFSLLNVAEHGAALFHEDILEAWVDKAESQSLGEGLLEYLRRDILGYCLRVDDNHGRNTAFFPTNDGLKLTPLFDFSPMFLADDPPARATLWRCFDAGQHAQWDRLFETPLPAMLGKENAMTLAKALINWVPTLQRTFTAFKAMDRSPRTELCAPRFEFALGVLHEICKKIA